MGQFQYQSIINDNSGFYKSNMTIRIIILVITTIFLPIRSGALAQQSHVSELEYIADSLYFIASTMPPVEQARYMVSLRLRADTLLQQGIQLHNLVWESADSARAVRADPIQLQYDLEFLNPWDEQKAVQNQLFASLIVLDSLWSKSPKSLLKTEEVLLINHELELIRFAENDFKRRSSPHREPILERISIEKKLLEGLLD